MRRDSALRFSGALQQEVMRALWRLGEGTVEDVRSALPKKRRGAYTTVQTVLNRLSERGLLRRQRSGAAFMYVPRMTEAQYLERSLSETLADASEDARQAALAGLVGDLDDAELKRIRARAADVARRRRKQ
jgi:predicted transcriptional regulator